MIADGSLALGLAWMDLDDMSSDDTVTLWILNLEDQDGVAGPPGDYLVTADSFNADGRAFNELAPATVVSGVVATAERHISLPIPLFPGMDASGLAIRRAILDGDISADGDGAALDNGTLTGAIPVSAVYQATNAYVGSTCPCIGDNLLSDSGECIGDSSTCSDSTCSQIGSLCGVIVSFISRATDIDLDGDGTPDALSVAIGIEAEGTVLDGLECE